MQPPSGCPLDAAPNEHIDMAVLQNPRTATFSGQVLKGPGEFSDPKVPKFALVYLELQVQLPFHLCRFNRVSCSTCWPGTGYVAEDD